MLAQGSGAALSAHGRSQSGLGRIEGGVRLGPADAARNRASPKNERCFDCGTRCCGARGGRPDVVSAPARGQTGSCREGHPLTTYPGSERSPTFSPDGTQVAFSWNGEKQDNYDIYVKMVDSGSAPLRLTTNPEPDGNPRGLRTAVTSRSCAERAFTLSRLSAGPNASSASCTPESFRLRDARSWTPDAKSLAVVDRIATTEPYKIFLVSIDTGEKRPLTDPPAHTLGDQLSFVFSRWPDARVCPLCRQSAADRLFDACQWRQR